MRAAPLAFLTTDRGGNPHGTGTLACRLQEDDAFGKVGKELGLI
jgi:hypothetical protein